jgi:hypothetical protein
MFARALGVRRLGDQRQQRQVDDAWFREQPDRVRFKAVASGLAVSPASRWP